MGLFDFLFGKRTGPSPPTPAPRELPAFWDADPVPTARQEGAARGSDESRDADLVDQAIELLMAGRHRQAVGLLSDVFGRAPDGYAHEEERDGKLHVRFWDLEEFMAYVVWMRERNASRDVVWLKNAYPRAAFHLGYAAIERGEFEQAVRHLDAGLRLQPGSGKLTHEKGQALIRLGQFEEAMELYEATLARPDFMAPGDRAGLLRGKGYAEIELGDLDAAEASFRESLELAPDHPVAVRELMFIEAVRRGEE